MRNVGRESVADICPVSPSRHKGLWQNTRARKSLHRAARAVETNDSALKVPAVELEHAVQRRISDKDIAADIVDRDSCGRRNLFGRMKSTLRWSDSPGRILEATYKIGRHLVLEPYRAIRDPCDACTRRKSFTPGMPRLRSGCKCW